MGIGGNKATEKNMKVSRYFMSLNITCHGISYHERCHDTVYHIMKDAMTRYFIS